MGRRILLALLLSLAPAAPAWAALTYAMGPPPLDRLYAIGLAGNSTRSSSTACDFSAVSSRVLAHPTDQQVAICTRRRPRAERLHAVGIISRRSGGGEGGVRGSGGRDR